MLKPESVLENETQLTRWDFEKQMDPQMSARRPDLVIVKKKENLPSSRLCRTERPQSKNKRKGKEREMPRSY